MLTSKIEFLLLLQWAVVQKILFKLSGSKGQIYMVTHLPKTNPLTLKWIAQGIVHVFVRKFHSVSVSPSEIRFVKDIMRKSEA